MHPDCEFLSFTNGTLIDEEFCREMLRVKNFVPAISLEGFEQVVSRLRFSLWPYSAAQQPVQWRLQAEVGSSRIAHGRYRFFCRRYRHAQLSGARPGAEHSQSYGPDGQGTA